MTIRVLLCDDHALVREAIRQVLADADDILLAAEADSGEAAVRTVRALAGDGAAIDVVLMDITMPHRDGLDALRQMRVEYPRMPVLMLSSYPDKQYAVRSMKLGAAGYLNKSADSRQMTGAIRKVVCGGLFITPSVAGQLAGAIGDGRALDNRAPVHEQLSHREYKVFRLICAGRSIAEIADELVLSQQAVASYRARVLDKTGARNDVELGLYAARAEMRPS
ncbi:response regulator [Piscinibacter sakaiensis]|uniref:response regulator n=1 Tax=Piscinibacter sakaiensis TaxID=1547922 RepID=UPI003AAD38B0